MTFQNPPKKSFKLPELVTDRKKKKKDLEVA
jgi:hypothetical protein